MNKKTAVLFPGQGSQYIGMGKEFFESSQDARNLMALAERAVNLPIRKLCFKGPMAELTKAVNLQPAITAINLICWQELIKAGIKPDYYAGHSLGEYSGLAAAGVLSVADALLLTAARGRLMGREGEKYPGGMRAVLGLTLSEVSAILAEVPEKISVVIANHNSEKQVVIAGDINSLAMVTLLVKEQKGKVIPLNVNIANHSPLVAGAVADFETIMAEVDFNTPHTAIWFNLTGSEEKIPDNIRKIMSQQIVSMVRWLDIINGLLNREVRVFIEVGPKTVLSGLLKKIIPADYQYQLFAVDTPATLAKCQQESS